MVTVALVTGAGSLAAAATKQELERAESRLFSLEKTIHSQQARLAELQSQVYALAGKIEGSQSRLADTQTHIVETHLAIRGAQEQYARLKHRLEGRARMAYEQGPTGLLSVVFDSASIGDLSDRLAFVGNVVREDADLANAMQDRAESLGFKRSELQALEQKQASALRDLRSQERALAAKFDEQRSVVAGLNGKQSQLEQLVRELKGKLAAQRLAQARAVAQSNPPTSGPEPGPTGGSVAGSPFQVCPVGSPHSYVDSFGAPRVGHVHAGNDIMAPEGTPIYAPFSGRASSSNGGLGGLEVYVYGSEGYVFNAHLSRVGQLGSVSAGTVVGYVGASGNASGGATHDHFEWHPRSIPANPYRSPYGYTVISGAIDPFPYLNQVC
jgi:peptidoglycan hydrolase CwlO-like protein